MKCIWSASPSLGYCLFLISIFNFYFSWFFFTFFYYLIVYYGESREGTFNLLYPIPYVADVRVIHVAVETFDL